MSLLILAFLGVLLYTPIGSVGAAVVYYVTPSEPPNPDCPLGESWIFSWKEQCDYDVFEWKPHI